MQPGFRARGAIAVLIAIVSVMLTGGALAATVTVTSTLDTITPNDGGVTLREAIAAINAGNDLGDPDITAHTSGAFGTSDTIHFSIPGSGVHTITLASGQLLLLSKPVVIDAYSQPGATPNSLAVGDNAIILIRIDQSTAPEAFHFTTGSDGSTLRGFSIVNTSSTAINVNANNVTIVGNFVGLDPDGSTQSGIASPVSVANVLNTHIGSGVPADRNVLDSNGSEMQLFGTFTTVAGNYINTNAAGSAARGTTVQGLSIGGGTVIIGGPTAAEGNVIGSWAANGINVGIQNLNFPIASVQINGNLIGVDAQGTTKLNPGANGIALGNGTYSAEIGHNQRNVISGAGQFGIVTTGETGSITIESNRIGTDVTGTVSIPNGQTGVCILSPVTGNIGNAAPGGGNIIANNGTQGIAIAANTNVTISGNSIFNNGGLGISLAGRCDIAGVAPTPNDAGDTDTGPNGLQNFPVITAASISGGQVTISGTFSGASDDIEVQFFSSAVCDPSGNGEGQTFLGLSNITTNGSGFASFGPLTFPIPPGQPVITATATNSANATSEFSACFAASGGGGLPTLSINNVSANEGNSGTTPFTFTVTLSAASASTVTVNFATADGTASAGSDYTATSGTLTFNPGVTTQQITVNVLGDTVPEANESFFVNLSAPTNATIATGQGTGVIVNDDAIGTPTLSINNVSASEGNSGTTPFTFTVTLSAASASTVTVNYATADGTATAGSDYAATSGTLTFAPGVTTQTITVNVNGDTTVEPNETFTVTLSGAANATIAGATGTGTIVNDDIAPPPVNVVIPTLDPRALGLLVLMLAAAAAVGLRRRR